MKCNRIWLDMTIGKLSIRSVSNSLEFRIDANTVPVNPSWTNIGLADDSGVSEVTGIRIELVRIKTFMLSKHEP